MNEQLTIEEFGQAPPILKKIAELLSCPYDRRVSKIEIFHYINDLSQIEEDANGIALRMYFYIRNSSYRVVYTLSQLSVKCYLLDPINTTKLRTDDIIYIYIEALRADKNKQINDAWTKHLARCN